MSKIGAHVSGHPRHTYESFCKAKPAVVLALNDGGALYEALTWSGEHTYRIFRDTTQYEETPGDINDPPGTYDQMAEYWYGNKLRPIWRRNPADYNTICNEGTGGGDDIPVFRNRVQYERAVMKLANQDGFKVVVWNLAGGSPGDFGVWVRECVPFIKEAFEAGNIYGRHAYEGNWERVYREAQYLLDEGLGYGGMVITEWGFDGGYGRIHNPEKIKDEDAALMAYPNIIGFCLWEYGDTGWDANIDPIVPNLVPYMSAHPTDKWKPGTPQVKTKEQYFWDLTVAEQKRVGLRLNPDAALQQVLGKSGLQIVHNEIYPSWEGQGHVIQAGEDPLGKVPRQVAVYQAGKPTYTYTDPYSSSDPLKGLEIGPPFRKQFVVTGPFGAKRDYDGDGTYTDFHEGTDYDIVGEPADSKEPVLAGFPGRVVKSGKSGGAYGFRVVIECIFNGTKFWLWYCHMDSCYVVVGDSVQVGTHLGELGDTGGDWPEHVHVNLQLETGGNSGPGWAVSHVVNPDPYISRVIQDPRIDMGKYFFPNQGEYGPIYMLSNNWGAGPERTQLQRIGNLSYVVKNQQWELREIGADFIRLKLDTSPGEDRYYTVVGNWLPRKMSVGDIFQRTERVQVFSKRDCTPIGAPYSSVSVLKLVEHYSDLVLGTNVMLKDVVRIEWVINNRVDETYWYAAGVGLVKWRKYTGWESKISEWVINQENNKREVINCL